MTTRQYSSRSQQSTLTGTITSGATSMTVVSGTTLLGGVTIPAGRTFTLVLDPDTALEEIVDATAVATNTFTITRAIDGSTAQEHSAGAVVRHMAIGRDFRDANLHAEASAYYNDGAGVGHTMHGISSGEGDVVGTAKTQTLTNKTLTSPVISNPTLTGTPSAEASIVFEGSTADAYETTLTVVDPTADRTIYLPDAGGNVVLDTATQTLSNKTMGSALNAGGFRITNIATPVDGNDAVNKTFADAQVAAAATSAASAATSATSAATSASSAATSASSALTSANSASTSASSALTSANSAFTYASTMAASVAAAQTSATSAAASATAAATSASSASTSASSALTSANSASTSASAASTSATSAAASATAASTSASSAATSASSALTSANSASTSATAAATSASSASASATAAATSASSAATSASSAAASYDQFDDRYLGDKTSDPTTDNDGNPLLTGALYFNTTIGAMKVYDGANWDLVAPDTSNFIDKAILTAKGSLISASTGSTPVALTVASTNGYILTVDSSTTSGLAWSAPAASGVSSVTAGDGIAVTGTTANPTVAVDSTVIRTTGGQVIAANTTATALEIRQTGSGNAFVVEDSTNPDSSPFLIDANGKVGIGGTPSAWQNVVVSKTIDGSANTTGIGYGVVSNGEIQNGSVAGVGYATNLSVAPSAAVTSIANFYAQGTTLGAGASITNNLGFVVDSSFVTTATSNVAFSSAIASGSGRWNFFASGTASNYFRGQTTVGSTSATLGGSGATQQFGVVSTSSTYVGVVVRGAASQSGNLQEWQNNSGTILARVNSAGQFVGDGSQLTGISGVSVATLEEVEQQVIMGALL